MLSQFTLEPLLARRGWRYALHVSPADTVSIRSNALKASLTDELFSSNMLCAAVYACTLTCYCVQARTFAEWSPARLSAPSPPSLPNFRCFSYLRRARICAPVANEQVAIPLMSRGMLEPLVDLVGSLEDRQVRAHKLWTRDRAGLFKSEGSNGLQSRMPWLPAARCQVFKMRTLSYPYGWVLHILMRIWMLQDNVMKELLIMQVHFVLSADSSFPNCSLP
jgi:hypothetical protein